ncbi:MAG: hypothetical protein AB8B82_14435 [Roseovarius sp.]
MRRGQMDAAPDYTNAALIMGLVNLLWIFMALWAVFGLPTIMLIGYALDKLISWKSRRQT